MSSLENWETESPEFTDNENDWEEEETAKVTFTAFSLHNISFRERKEVDTFIPQSDWNEMTEEEKNNELREDLQEWANELLEITWEE